MGFGGRPSLIAGPQWPWESGQWESERRRSGKASGPIRKTGRQWALAPLQWILPSRRRFGEPLLIELQPRLTGDLGDEIRDILSVSERF